VGGVAKQFQRAEQFGCQRGRRITAALGSLGALWQENLSRAPPTPRLHSRPYRQLTPQSLTFVVSVSMHQKKSTFASFDFIEFFCEQTVPILFSESEPSEMKFSTN